MQPSKEKDDQVDYNINRKEKDQQNRNSQLHHHHITILMINFIML